MLCPKCHIEMQLIRFADHTGPDGSMMEKQYRCTGCWFHETVTVKRRAS